MPLQPYRKPLERLQEAEFSPSGAMVVGEQQTIKDYRFAYNGLDNLFFTETAGTGTSTYETVSSTSLLTCDTASGDLAKRTSHFYHPYAPGIGTIFEMTARIGDSGKTNVRRRWGYYDDNDGLFFELDGTDLYVVLRSSVSGAVVDTRTAQADFSKSRLDGDNNIKFNLDVSRPNFYFIDFQWLGSGRVQFGVVDTEGHHLVAHIIENTNADTLYPYIRTATLPFRFEQENTGISASTSEMRVACAVVKHSSRVLIIGEKQAADSGFVGLNDAEGEKPIMSVRPKLTFNGISNHALMKFVSLSLGNFSVSGNQLVVFRTYIGSEAGMTGASFASHAALSIAEVDTAATAISGFKLILVEVLSGDNSVTIQDLAPRELHQLELFNFADGITQPVFTLTAELSGSGNATVVSGINWEEFLL